jgi:hypothetical protein
MLLRKMKYKHRATAMMGTPTLAAHADCGKIWLRSQYIKNKERRGAATICT